MVLLILTHFAARRYASAVHAMAMCLSVRPSVRHNWQFCQNG